MSIEQVRISAEQALVFSRCRGVLDSAPHSERAEEARLTIKRLWLAIKKQHGLPEQARYRVSTDPTSDNYCVVCDKYTGIPVGRAKSGMPYGAIPLATLVPFLNTQWETQVPLPAEALHIGAGVFIHGESLYFPAL